MPPPQPPPYDPTDIKHHTIPTFTFLSGTTLHDLTIAYRSYNPSAASKHGTVLIPTCFAGKINTTLTFNSDPSSALHNYHVVVVAMLSNGESSSPSNKSFFPGPGELHYEDLVHAQHDLLTNGLGVTQLEAVIGFSMGGQQAYHWGVMYPDFVKRVVGICTSARTSGHNYAFLEGPIAAMTSSIDYVAWKQIQAKIANGDDVGAHLREVKPKQGLAAWARVYAAWLTSATWFREREWEKMGCKNLEEWMALREAGYAEWNADDLLVKARMWQLGDVGSTKRGVVSQLGHAPGDDGALGQALGSITAKVLLMPCRSDQYFRPEDNEDELKHLKDGRLEVIESSWGHIAGGGANPVDVKLMDAKIAEHMQR
ncbi:hypothetical protein PMZ80_004805 [Knufia obscura]|uniref:AB hydrolase-1 domain-containing protein n=1 Tax=Knufia obscura TaxID=1635080 RepID=A0ABR0RNQ0_9EURO|nr:hypothetical protein PMZ80_004805 [Knufia obscura]